MIYGKYGGGGNRTEARSLSTANTSDTKLSHNEHKSIQNSALNDSPVIVHEQKHNILEQNNNTNITEKIAPTLHGKISREDDELRRIVEMYPNLSVDDRAQILDIIRKAKRQ